MNTEPATPPQVGTDVNRSLRYDHVGRGKSDGVTYTPSVLADFVARQIVRTGLVRSGGNPLRLLDPAVGHGELLVSLLQHLQRSPSPMSKSADSRPTCALSNWRTTGYGYSPEYHLIYVTRISFPSSSKTSSSTTKPTCFVNQVHHNTT